MNLRSEQMAPATLATGFDDEGIILLTEVLEEASSEVVLEISPGEGLEALRESLKAPSPPAEAPAESLDEFLASLEDLPGESVGLVENAAPKAPEASLFEAGVLREAVRRDLALILETGELRTAFQELVQETVAQLCRELFPQVAREVIGQEIEVLKKCLAGLKD